MSVKLVYIGVDHVDSSVIIAPGYNNFLTIGKIYCGEVNGVPYNYYFIRNDNNITNFYNKLLFKTLDEVRSEKIDKILYD